MLRIELIHGDFRWAGSSEITMIGIKRMTIKEKRPFPVPSEVVMRSALFTLANMNARLQVYNEETGVIVAGMPKWLGFTAARSDRQGTPV